MTLDGYHADVMSSKILPCWIFFVIFCSQGVARDCASFDNYISSYLLKDHLFEIPNFQQPGETVEEGYTLLSIVNMLCLSLKEYKDLYNLDEATLDFKSEDKRALIKWAYRELVKKSLNLTKDDEILTACKKHACNFFFNKSHIRPNELKEKVCSVREWTRTLPKCPTAKNPTSSAATHNSSHQSTNHLKKDQDDLKKKEDQHLFYILSLTVSVTCNFALIIVVGWQCRNRHQRNLPDSSKEISEFSCLQEKDQSQPEANKKPSSTIT